MNPDMLAIAREHDVAVVHEDDDTYPSGADLTSSFVYLRLRRSVASIETGYSVAALERWAHRADDWETGREPTDLPRVAPKSKVASQNRDVFVYIINGAKERTPAAAQKLLSILDGRPRDAAQP